MKKKATFAAGCFWGVEEAFRRREGVVRTTVGYSGGDWDHPVYEEVCTGLTGHAESVLVEYDPARISYEQLLDTFWEIHDPTTPNRQGPDVGNQYRSVIFCHDDDQKRAAIASRDRLEAEGRFRRPIVTEIVPAAPFHRAEEYHQHYILKHGSAHCHIHF